MEILNPHRIIATQKEISELQLKINGSTDMISIRDLQLITKDQLGPLKEGEEEKTKVYSALCVTLDGSCFTSADIEKINSVSQVVINQKTPLRVLHRFAYSTNILKNKILLNAFIGDRWQSDLEQFSNCALEKRKTRITLSYILKPKLVPT